ncbi:MAG: hypothetical protein ABR928_11220 [Terracidiphilus sp.]|jgi:hypothetical protein
MEARNQWQPVTEVYQQIIDPVAASHIDDDPMTMVNAIRQARSLSEGKVPFGITAITGAYFLRAAVYILFAIKLAASADSDLATWITSHCPALIPLSLGSVDHKKLPTTMAEVLGVMAVLSLGIGVMWLLRWVPILFISIAFSGYVLAYFVISYFNIAGLGNPDLFTGSQIDLIVVEAAINLLIFFFIALYPGLKKSFRRDF